MSGIIYHSDLIIDNSATVTASTEATGFEDDYLIDKNPGTFWRSDATVNQTITIDMGASVSIAAAIIKNHNIGAGDVTFDFEGSNDSGFATKSTIAVTKTDDPAIVEPSWSAYRYYRWVIEKASGYSEAALIGIFQTKYEFDKNYAKNFTVTVDSGNIRNETFGGQIYETSIYQREIWNVQIVGATATQRDAFKAISTKFPIYFSPETGTVMLGKFDINSYSHMVSELWNLFCTFRESAD